MGRPYTSIAATIIQQRYPHKATARAFVESIRSGREVVTFACGYRNVEWRNASQRGGPS